MNKHYLMSQMKSTGIAYLCWFFIGCHYAYLGKWGIQILYWLTLGGLGIWAFLDLFLIPSKVNSHNFIIARQIDQIEKREQAEAHERNLALMGVVRTTENTENKFLLRIEERII